MKSTMQDAQLTIGSLMLARHHGARRRRGRDRDRRRRPQTVVRRAGPSRRPAGPRAARPRHHRRPAGRDVPVEQRRAPRGLPRGPVDGCGAPHAQHPALPRAAGLHRQPRRGPGRHRRRLAGPLLAAQLPHFETVTHVRGRRARRGRRRPRLAPCQRQGGAALRGPARRAARRVRLARGGRASTPRRCATPAAPPATRRASSTATAPRGCTRWPSAPATSAASTATTGSCRSCRCSTPTPGAWRTPP